MTSRLTATPLIARSRRTPGVVAASAKKMITSNVRSSAGKEGRSDVDGKSARSIAMRLSSA
jgi:hypothetical protein